MARGVSDAVPLTPDRCAVACPQRAASACIVSLSLFAGIFLAYTVNDTGYRGRLDSESGVRYSPRAGEWAPGGTGRPEGEPVFPSP